MQGESVLRECFRVLKPGGCLRLTTPDLETTIKDYLQILNNLKKDSSKENFLKHEWIILELIDQSARNFPSGEMGQYL